MLSLDSVSYHQASAIEKFCGYRIMVLLLIPAATQAAEPFLNIISDVAQKSNSSAQYLRQGR